MKNLFFVLTLLILSKSIAQIKTGAERTNLYFPLLHNSRVALVVNQTSTIGKTHLVDSLLGYGINVVKVFAPEHGFRGKQDAGQKVNTQIDSRTNLPILSLYGKSKKLPAEYLTDVDIVIFDIQDVGTRFYTYISTMHYVMETCAEEDKQIVVLDRPNPNGNYVAGPVLDTNYRSFVGMHPIPIVHGLTVCELAQMINKEGWLKNGVKAKLYIIPCDGYTHQSKYSLPIKPSPNLPNDQAIFTYPSLCLFEATKVSVGRGTKTPFQKIGGPDFQNKFDYQFTPESLPGAKSPRYKGKECFGLDFTQSKARFSLSALEIMYKASPTDFFTRPDFFDLLAGTDQIRKQLLEGKSAAEIEKSWQPQLQEYLTLRKKYLLYPDFR